MANVHPWFANVSIDDAASWITTFFQQNDVDTANSLPNKPSMSIAETGMQKLSRCFDKSIVQQIQQAGQQYVLWLAFEAAFSFSLHLLFQKSSDAGNANNGPSVASVANLQTFIDTFVCQANSAGTQYFFFEFADEDWKDQQFGGVEGWWGLFNQK